MHAAARRRSISRASRRRRDVPRRSALWTGEQRVVRPASPLAELGVRRVVAQLRVLEHLAQGVDAEAVDAAVEPEAQHVEHRLAHGRVAPVEVGLLAQVGVRVVLARAGVEGPGRAAEHAQPVVGRAAVRAPEVPVALRVVTRRARVARTTGARPRCGWGRSRGAPSGRARARPPPARRSPRACRTAGRSRVWSEMS